MAMKFSLAEEGGRCRDTTEADVGWADLTFYGPEGDAERTMAQHSGADGREMGLEQRQRRTPGNSMDPSRSRDPGKSMDPSWSRDPGKSMDPSRSRDPGKSMDPSWSRDPGKSMDPSWSRDPCLL